MPPSEALTPFEGAAGGGPKASLKVPLVELEEQFRAMFARLGTSCAKLRPLPEDCSFTMCIELRDVLGVDPPMGHPQPWIPAQPSLQPPSGEGWGEGEDDDDDGGGGGNGGGGGTRDKGTKSKERGSDLGGVRTTPVRSLEAGEFVMEMWIEEGRGKEVLGTDLESSGTSL